MVSTVSSLVRLCLILFAVCPWMVQTSDERWELDENFDHVFTFPILLLHSDGQNNTVTFQFNFRNVELSKTVSSFCNEYQIEKNMCNKLYETSVQRRIELLDRKMMDDQTRQNSSVLKLQFIPNPHLKRRLVATTSEIDNRIKVENVSAQMQIEMDYAFQKIHLILSPVLSRNIPNHQAAVRGSPGKSQNTYNSSPMGKSINLNQLQLIVIHSCSLPGENSRILASLLSKIVTSGLIERRVQVLVLNYGELWDSGAIHPYFYHPRIHFVHVSNQISFFEIPTLILLQKLSNLLNQYSMPLSQILYLHTKGVSYQQVYSQIEDWRDFMLHFLVERHLMCYHLLASGEIDTVGVNFRSKGRDFRGNFWWVTSQYISSLASLSLYSHGKYDAEQWMLSASNVVRIFNAHEAVIDHHVTRYERENYESDLTLKTVESTTGTTFSVPFRWFDMNAMPNDQQKYSYCRTKRMSWSSMDDLLSSIVALT